MQNRIEDQLRNYHANPNVKTRQEVHVRCSQWSRLAFIQQDLVAVAELLLG